MDTAPELVVVSDVTLNLRTLKYKIETGPLLADRILQSSRQDRHAGRPLNCPPTKMHACTALFVVVFYAALAHAWLPSSRDLAAFNATARYAELGQQKAPKKSGTNNRIRGVNFGGWLISEPWMMSQEWNETLNCGNAKSEFDCMLQAKNTSEQNDRFEDHWKNWITPDSVKSVYDVGLNSIRIPIGMRSF